MKSWLRAPGFSPKGFVVRAAVLALVYGLLSLAGLRDSMSVLSLTYPEGSSRGWSAICCMAYLVSYFLWILGVPILLLAAGLLQSLTWIQARRRKPG
jgi:hypothetical protein